MGNNNALDILLLKKLSIPRLWRRILSRWEVFLIATLLFIAALAHGFNMFNFPYYQDDEGTYMSQAWTILNEGRLAPYFYWYDHAPLGWIQIAGWTIVTGGFHAFGTAMESGRVMMLFIQVCSALFLYCITRCITKSVPIAVLVLLIFALSPSGIYFHRRVLLDNIATFWMLLSILLLVLRHLSLKRVWLSALALGIGILSKEVIVFVIPIMAYLTFFRADRSIRWMALCEWVVLVMLVVSLYPFMAFVRGELFPTGTWLGGTNLHVSLLGSLQAQASRGQDGGLLNFHSAFWQVVQLWARDEPLLIVGGSFGALLSLLVIKKQRLVGLMGMLTFSLWAFMARGGQVYDFYLVPLLPLLALNVGFLINLLVEQAKRLCTISISSKIARAVELIAISLCIVGSWSGYTSPRLGYDTNHFLLWNGSQAVSQRQVVWWVHQHISPSCRIVISQYMWMDLHDTSSNAYPFAHYYWKVETDPDIRNKIFQNDWHNIDYVITTINMLVDVQEKQMTLVGAAIDHSVVIAHFDSGGWPTEVRKVSNSRGNETGC